VEYDIRKEALWKGKSKGNIGDYQRTSEKESVGGWQERKGYDGLLGKQIEPPARSVVKFVVAA
jgi:hypothetical protein